MSMMSNLLDRKARVERLREIVAAIKRGEQFSAFDLAVRYFVSINVVYRDIKTLRDEGLIPADWNFTRKEPLGCIEGSSSTTPKGASSDEV